MNFSNTFNYGEPTHLPLSYSFTVISLIYRYLTHFPLSNIMYITIPRLLYNTEEKAESPKATVPFRHPPMERPTGVPRENIPRLLFKKIVKNKVYFKILFHRNKEEYKYVSFKYSL